MKSIISKLTIVSLLLGHFSCTDNSGDGFGALEEKDSLDGGVDLDKLEAIQKDESKPIVILGGDPADETIVVGNKKAVVFRLNLSPISGAVKTYTFQLNTDEPIEKESGSHQLVWANLNEGINTLKISAANDVSKGEYTFRILRDELPNGQIGSPDYSGGNVLECRTDPLVMPETPNLQKFNATFTDVEDKSLKFSWRLNGTVISDESENVNNKALFAQIELPIDCAVLGKQDLILVVEDANNEVLLDLGYVVHDPALDLPDPVEILSHSPLDDPYVINGSTIETFTVTLKPGNLGAVKYKWKLDDNLQGGEPYAESFFRLDGSSITAGYHTVAVEVSNAAGSASHSFNVFRNTPPSISNTAPADSGTVVQCPSESVVFSAESSDIDLDNLTFTWKLDGIENNLLFSGQTNTFVSTDVQRSEITFTPSCTEQGTRSVSLIVDDGSDQTIHTWSAVVSNPSIATIDFVSPATNPVVILSTGDQDFSIIASGKAPLTYSWTIDGTPIPGATGPTYSINNGDLAAGNYLLRVVVQDSDSNDDYTWNVKQNASPSLSNLTPNSPLKKMNKNNISIFTVDGVDANGDAIAYTWTLNSLGSPFLASSVAGPTAQAIFSPDDSILGKHTLKVVATDGYESVSHTWNVEVNLFSSYCNDMGPGDICTIAGRPGRGDGLQATDRQVLIRPWHIAEDGAGNYFFVDYYTYSVFFHNQGATPVVRLGVTVGPGEVKVVLGNGVYRSNQVANVGASDFQGYYPTGIVYDSTRSLLYMSERYRYRVLRVNSVGLVEQVFGGTSTNNAGTNLNGAVATNHFCQEPMDLAIEESSDTVFVACSHNNSRKVKYFSPASSATIADIDGFNGYATTGNPFGLDIDSNGNVYVSIYNQCKIEVYVRGPSPGPVVGNGACNFANPQNEYANTDRGRWRNSYDVAVREVAGNVVGYFISGRDIHRIYYANVTGSPVTLGDQVIGANSFQFVIGTGNAEFGGEGLTGVGSHTAYPMGLDVTPDGTKLIYADAVNFRLRELDLTVPSGEVNTIAGGGEWVRGHNGDDAKPGNEMMLNYPHYGTVHNGRLYISELVNNRIRRLDLTTGEMINAIGEGGGTLNEGAPSGIRFRAPMGITSSGSSVIFLDNQNYTNNNQNPLYNCAVRAFNPNAFELPNVFGTTIQGNYVKTIGGNFSLGCQLWQNNLSFDNSDALSVSFRGEGIAFVDPNPLVSDDEKLYITDYRSHCIYSIDMTGNTKLEVGVCGTAGTSNDNETLVSGLARLRFPKGIAADTEVPGSYFFIDKYDQSFSVLKYVNMTNSPVSLRSIDNSVISIPAGSIGVAANLPSRYGNDVAVFDSMICVAAGYENGVDSTQSVYCFDRYTPGQQITIGAPTANTKAGIASGFEQEGVPSSSAKLYNPHGLTFDSNGNLYIIERLGSKVRKVNRWW